MRNKIVIASLVILLAIIVLFFITSKPNSTITAQASIPANRVKPIAPSFTQTPIALPQLIGLNLGTRLGVISLNDSPNKVLQVLGEPKMRTVAQGNGSPEWVYANGLTIDGGKTIWKIIANAPFQGATAEGFRLDDDKATYQRLYANFGIRAIPTGNHGFVHDANGVNLNIDFDSNGKAITIELDKDS